MLQKIAIKMLGDFSVVADGRCVVDATAKLTKPWQLFCYLALNREHVTPSSVLLQELWGGEELAAPANVLKNTVYALRRELAGPVKPAESPILFRAGGYCLNGHIKWSVDTERFEQLCEKAERCTGGSEAKMAAWRKAEGAFRGELLPQLAGEVWVMRAARGFTRRYLASARALCACLAGENAYGELLDVASRASVTDPLDEDIALWTFRALDADVFCIQETKMQPGQADFAPEGYTEYINSAEKKGYSGTLIYTRVKPLNAWNGIGVEAHSHEGRAITLEFEDYYLVNVYVPNSQNELARIDYRMQWEDDLRAYLKDLDSKKPVILCGDLNVAHEDIDLKNPGPNRGAAGFSDQERGKLNELLAAGFTDSFRYLYPDATGMYSWWSMRFRARERNAGWRIDYFLITEELKKNLADSKILSDVMGSDHCPVLLEL